MCRRYAASPVTAIPSRSNGINARLKYSALPSSVVTTLTLFSSDGISLESNRQASVAISAFERTSPSATSSRHSGGISGSSPCRLTTMVPSSKARYSAADAKRSVPDCSSGDVITVSQFEPRNAVTTASWSVATTILEALLFCA